MSALRCQCPGRCGTAGTLCPVSINSENRATPSLPLRPFARFGERFARFEQALETGENVRPAIRDGLDEFRIGLVELVEDRELDRITHLFEFVRQARKAFGTQFGPEF